jgi:hypothetical protein
MSTTRGREAVIAAFDRLFDRALARLNVSCSAEEKEEARRTFLERYEQALQFVDQTDLPPIPEPAMARMEQAIDQLSPAVIAGHLATAPLAMHVQEHMRALALRAAEQRLLEQLASRADDSYGGN